MEELQGYDEDEEDNMATSHDVVDALDDVDAAGLIPYFQEETKSFSESYRGFVDVYCSILRDAMLRSDDMILCSWAKYLMETHNVTSVTFKDKLNDNLIEVTKDLRCLHLVGLNKVRLPYHPC